MRRVIESALMLNGLDVPSRSVPPEAHLVVSDVSEPDQRQGVGKALRPVGVAVADLAENGDQRLVPQRIDLVEKDDQRPRCRGGPRGQCGRVGAAKPSLTHTAVCNMLVCMNVDRLSITLDPRLGAAARKAAKRAKVSLSTWIAEATADRIRNELLGEALDRWEAEDGALTQAELDRAAEALGLSRRRKARRA